jgi:hypothetical protein
MSLLVGALIVALVAAGFVVYPLLYRRWGSMADAIPASVQDREARKRVALAALKDVEYDRIAGKLDDTDYHDIRGKLEAEAVHALHEAAQPVPGSAGGPHVCGFNNPIGSRYCAGCGQRLA